MALLKGARIAVNAPNSATNRLLTSSGVQAACRSQAQILAQQMFSAAARSDMSQTEKKRRYPVLMTMQIATTFKGTTRSGAAIKGNQWGLRKQDVESALGNKVTWK